MPELSCAAPRCRIPRRHDPGCADQTCQGCVVAQAAPGLRLCHLHATRVATDAARAAELDHELEEVLGAWGRRDERTSGNSTTGTVINERAVEMRSEIRAVLTSWVRLVADERGHSYPPDTLTAIGAWLAANSEWLAAHPAAGDCSDELSSLVRRAQSVAYPSGARVFPVGPCPSKGCTAAIRVILRHIDSEIPSELICDGTHETTCECGSCPPHRFPSESWRSLGKKIIRRYMSPLEIADEYRLPLGTIYRHASEQGWRRAQDGRRPALYLADDVRATLDITTSAEGRSS